jgi:hypothetical protein
MVEYRQREANASRQSPHPTPQPYRQAPQPTKSKRLEALERAREAKTDGRIRVEPANADLRLHLRHPTAGGFRGRGGADWPHDQFTMRRLKEGSIRKSADQRKPK